MSGISFIRHCCSRLTRLSFRCTQVVCHRPSSLRHLSAQCCSAFPSVLSREIYSDIRITCYAHYRTVAAVSSNRPSGGTRSRKDRSTPTPKTGARARNSVLGKQGHASNDITGSVNNGNKKDDAAAVANSSSDKGDTVKDSAGGDGGDESGEKAGIMKRFHQTYKQHGKILIGVHLVTSTIWTSIFFCAAYSGVDVVPLLEWLGAGEKIIAPFKMPGVGYAAVTYLMYKLATPARYTVTIAGTHFTVRYMREHGYLPQIEPDNRIRSLVTEKIDEVKERRRRSKRSKRSRKVR